MVRVAVLGAGPTGVDAALAAQQAGFVTTLYESGPRVAQYVRDWGHVRLFTPWAMSLSPRIAAASPSPDPSACPTGDDLADHLERVASLLDDVRLSTRVEVVSRAGLLKSEEIGSDERARRPFRLLVTGRDGAEHVAEADVVLDCTGTYGNPNPTGSGGVAAPGERSADAFVVRTIPRVDASWRDRRVLLVGAGNSAQTVARDLAASEVAFTWVVRRASPTWGAVDGDPLPDRVALVESSRRIAAGDVASADLRTGVEVESFAVDGGALRVGLSDGSEVVTDVVVSMTGAVGDSSLFRPLQVHQCYATEGPMNLAATLLGSEGGDCLAQISAGIDALRNPEPRFFVLGSKSYGRNNTFLMRVGWEQVDEVVAALRDELQPA